MPLWARARKASGPCAGSLPVQNGGMRLRSTEGNAAAAVMAHALVAAAGERVPSTACRRQHNASTGYVCNSCNIARRVRCTARGNASEEPPQLEVL